MKEDLIQGKESFSMEIPADENNLGDVRDFIADICIRAGFSKRETNNTKLAVDEACTNIIKHAYSIGFGDINIEVEAESGKVDINIYDHGESFEWSKIKDPDLHRYVEIGKKGGLGVFLMNRLMDELDYYASESGNRLFMSKISENALSIPRQHLFQAVKPKWTSTLRFKFALRTTLGLFGMVLFLWIIQFISQSREIEEQLSQAWSNMSSIAKTLESKSENAMVIDDLYHPEYREINDFIQDRIVRFPAVKYVRVVNNDGIIVSSSILEEFQDVYEFPDDFKVIPGGGTWRHITGDQSGNIEEYHYPVSLSEKETGYEFVLGRVILGVLQARIEGGIYDPRPRSAMILGGIFLIGLALIYLLVSVLVRPIQALTDGVRALGEGALEEGIHIEGPEEIGAIAEAFNEITMKFRDAQQSVVEQERMRKEMQVAQEIQHSLLPSKVPDISGYEISSLYRAAREVGGDYYDFVNVGENSLGIVVADVSGKGVPGSLVMTMIRTALRMEARGNLSAADVMSSMNDFVTEDMKKGMFVTIFYLILDSRNRVISYASAGHNPMILFRAETDETFLLNPRGFPVGIGLPDNTLFRRSIDVEKIKLKKDDMLVIYTDGVTEAMNKDREQYGEDRLLRVIKVNGKKTPDEFIEALNKDIKEFTGDFPQNDDITVVAVKEKMMADDVLVGIRKKLLDLVEVDGFSVAEACSKMKVSPSTYYRYKKRLAELGERGLKNKTLREEYEIRRVSTEQRKSILEIVRDFPGFGAKRIADEFNRDKHGKNRLSPSLIYDELKRMRLNTYEKRLEYLRRNRFISEEEYQGMLASPAGKTRRSPGAEKREERKESPAESTEVAPELGRKPDMTESLHPRPETDRENIPVPDEYSALPESISAEPDKQPEEPSEKEFDVERILSGVLGDYEKSRLISIKTEDHGNGIVALKVRGHLDSSSASDLENILEIVFEGGFRKIIVDLGEVSYISSGGWGIFTGRVKMLREGQGDVVLAGMSPEVFDIYELLGFQDIIMHFQKVDEAFQFISLPFDTRQQQLEESSRGRQSHKALEHRISVDAGMVNTEEESSPWTPLIVEAGTVGESGEITVLNLKGVIDTVSCMKLKDIMHKLMDKGSVRLVVDMSGVEYVSSAGWGVFASRIDEFRGRGGDIKIFGMDPEVNGIFHLLGFDVIMRSFSILTEAIEDFEGSVITGPSRSVEKEKEKSGWLEARETAVSSDEKVKLLSDLRFSVSRMKSSGRESLILHLSGAIDAATTEDLELHLKDCLLENPRYLIIDMTDIIYMSSSGWGIIIKYIQQLQSWSGRMALTGMSPPIFKIFRDLGFEPLIPHYLSSEKALEELSAPALEQHEENKIDLKHEKTGDEVTKSVTDINGEKGQLSETAQKKIVDKYDPDIPRVDVPGVEPLYPRIPEKIDVPEVMLDLEDMDAESIRKDSKVRGMGWKRYGEKLSRSNKKRK